MNDAALQIIAAKVQKFPLEDKQTGDIVAFIDIGIRVELGDGSWWFRCFKSNTWTRHWWGTEMGRGMDANRKVERKEAIGDDVKLLKAFGHCPKLIQALWAGEAIAIEEEAARRMG